MAYLSLLLCSEEKISFIYLFIDLHIFEGPSVKFCDRKKTAIRKEWTGKIFFFLSKTVRDLGGSDLEEACPFWLLALRAVRVSDRH